MTDIQLDDLAEVEESDVELYHQAKGYLESFNWCVSVKKVWQDKLFWIPEKVGVFLFEIVPINDGVDDFIWIITGDLPSVYLDKAVKSGQEALEIYCELMEEWVEKVRNSESAEECYPVDAEPSIENAELLDSRIAFIRKELLTEE